jgi:tetratricopeptide (TPR) repeat protein
MDPLSLVISTMSVTIIAIIVATIGIWFAQRVQQLSLQRRELEAPTYPSPVSEAVLPIPSTRGFVNREKELERLWAYLRDPNKSIILVEGIAGIGKTMLAARFAEQIRDEYVVFWMNCKSEVTLESLFLALARYIDAVEGRDVLRGVAEDSRRGAEEKVDDVITVLGRSKYALFLDDYHLSMDQALDTFVKAFSRYGRTSKILLIARARPDFLSELDPLSVAEELLLRGLDANSTIDFLRSRGLAKQSDSELRQIWQKTDGHPLAMILFISLTRYHTVDELLRDLPAFTEELGSRWMMEVYRGLSVGERELAACASIFREPVPREALACLHAEDNVDDMIELLVDKFLLERSENYEFYMHPLVRDFFYPKTSIEDRQESHRRAGDYYLRQYSLGVDRPDLGEEEVEDKLEAIYHFTQAEDYERAHQIIRDIKYQLYVWGRLDQLLNLLDKTLETSKTLDVSIIIYKSKVLKIRGKGDEGLELLTAYAKQAEDAEARATLMQEIADNYEDKGDYDRAMELYHNSLCIREELGDKKNIAGISLRLGALYRNMGDYEKARELYFKCLAIAEEIGDRTTMAGALHKIGEIYQYVGDFAEAIAYYQPSLKLSEQLGYKRQIAMTLHNLALLYRDSGDYENAAEHYQRSYEIYQQLGDERGLANILNLQATIHRARGEYDRALQMFRQCLTAYNQIGDQKGIASTLYQLGDVHAAIGEYQEAIELYQQSLKLEQKLDNEKNIAILLRAIAHIREETSEFYKAYDLMRQANTLFEQLNIKSAYRESLQDLERIRNKLGIGHIDADST